MKQPSSRRRTVVATLGPASFHQAAELARAGANAFRVNGSHMTPAEIERALHNLRDVTPRTPVVLDLQGAKMRLGSFEPLLLEAGQSIDLVNAPDSSTAVPLPHAALFRSVRVGDTLRCDDDRMRLQVQSVSSTRLRATVLVDGVLRARKGVNVVEHPIDLDGLTLGDRAQIEVAAQHDGLSFACSFMRDGREAGWIRSLAPGLPVIGKVERGEAIEALPAIARTVDTLWICRGDLGAQLGLVEMARWLSDFDPTRLPVPTLIAGQVLEHLTHHADPTRSEVCHLHDMLRRGFSGLVLSDETAVGVDPVHATAIARQLADTLG